MHRHCIGGERSQRVPNSPHRRAGNYYSVIANMRGKSAEEVAGKILASELLRGLQVGRSSTVMVMGSTILISQTQSSTP